MTLYLMNSSMMPVSGIYYNLQLDQSKFVLLFRRLKGLASEIRSSIGYQQNAVMLSRMLDYPVKMSMEQTKLVPGDFALAMRLSYRTRQKGAPVDEDDFEYFVVVYCGHSPELLEDRIDLINSLLRS